MSQHPRPIQGAVPSYVPVTMMSTVRGPIPPLAYNQVPYGVNAMPQGNHFVNAPVVYPNQLTDASSGFSRMTVNPGLQRVYMPFHQPVSSFRDMSARQRAPVDPAKLVEQQRKVEKERNFQMQQQRLKQFTIAGKKGTVNAESLLDSMFGKPDTKKNCIRIAEKEARNSAVSNEEVIKSAQTVMKPVISAPVFSKTETAKIPDDNLKERDPKELENLMMKCSDFTGPQKAKIFQKTAVRQITKNSHQGSTFSTSDKSVDWRSIQGLDNVFTAPESRFPAWCKQECVPPPFVQIQNLVTNYGVQPPETSVLYRVLLSSGLPQNTLSEIWELVNQTIPNCLTNEEMYAALALVAVAQAGHPVKSLSILHQLPSCPIPHLQCFNQSPKSDTSVPNEIEKAPADEAMEISTRPSSIQTSTTNVKNTTTEFASWNPFPTPETEEKPQDIEDDFDDFKSATPMAVNASPLIEHAITSDDDFDDFKQAPRDIPATFVVNVSEKLEKFPTSFSDEPLVSQQDLMLPEDKYSAFRLLRHDASDSETSALTSDGKISNSEVPKNTGLFGTRKPLLCEENSNSSVPDDSENSLSPIHIKKNDLEDEDFGDFLDATDTPVVTPGHVPTLPGNQSSFIADFADFSQVKTDVMSPEIEISKPDFPTLSLNNKDNFGAFSSFHQTLQKPDAAAHDYFFPCIKDNISLAESQSISSLELGTFDGAGHSGESKSSLSRQGSIPSLDLKVLNSEMADAEDDFGDMQSVVFTATPSPSPSVETNKSSDEKFYPAVSTLTPTLIVPLADKYSVIRSEQVFNEDPHIGDWTKCINSCLSILQNAMRIFNQMSSSLVCNELLGTDEGKNYVKDVIEVYKVVCRVSLASKSYEKQNDKLSKLIEDANQAFNTLTVFMTGTALLMDDFLLDFSSGVLKPEIDSNEKACGVCLLNVDTRSKAFNNSEDLAKLRYGNRQYHCACANLWVNCVDPLLPVLTLPQLI